MSRSSPATSSLAFFQSFQKLSASAVSPFSSFFVSASVLSVYPQKALRRLSQGSFGEIGGRYWGQFVCSYRQKWTKSSTMDFRFRFEGPCLLQRKLLLVQRLVELRGPRARRCQALRQREVSLLTTYWSGSTDVFGGPASRHGSLNSLFQVALYLPSCAIHQPSASFTDRPRRGQTV